MHYHYYTLLHLSHALRKTCIGQQVVSCFSQQKNEMILELSDLFLRIGCHTPMTYLVPVSSFSRARRNVAELMPALLGCTVEDIRVVPYDRVLILELSGDKQLICKMHGVQANVLLRVGGQIEEVFNRRIEEDISYVEQPGRFEPDLMTAPQAPDPDLILRSLKKVSPVLEKMFAQRVATVWQAGGSCQEALAVVLDEAASDVFYLSRDTTQIRLLLFPPPSGQPALRIPGVMSALSLYLRLTFQQERYRELYREAEKEIIKPWEKIRKALASHYQTITHLEQERQPDELGNILLANLHLIPANTPAIVLDDYYQGGQVTIKLDPALSPLENATRYFDKYRQRKNRLAFLYEEVEELSREAETQKELARACQALPHPDELLLTTQGLDPDAIAQMKTLSRQWQQGLAQTGAAPPFRRFQKGEYEIFVGKNARNNDELSFRFAAKHDIWLHAKDVPGSHVIIRTKPGRHLPVEVLEYAAALAAYFSKRKNDTLVPVQYTPRRFIHKRKGDPAGMVVTLREEVLMIEPLRSLTDTQ
ncbi:MAG: NFACT RNA binding domain-containing protein [Bacteroidia bacterium]|nr:NFACT RNA binding domain-containing protein [Bacteroidia bacterium]